MDIRQKNRKQLVQSIRSISATDSNRNRNKKLQFQEVQIFTKTDSHVFIIKSHIYSNNRANTNLISDQSSQCVQYKKFIRVIEQKTLNLNDHRLDVQKCYSLTEAITMADKILFPSHGLSESYSLSLFNHPGTVDLVSAQSTFRSHDTNGDVKKKNPAFCCTTQQSPAESNTNTKKKKEPRRLSNSYFAYITSKYSRRSATRSTISQTF